MVIIGQIIPEICQAIVEELKENIQVNILQYDHYSLVV